ncbi:DUF4852 domain-containing protein [Micavibrio aeruginosavorus]|uniref:DUF4852 domain-containing protein n=1 Tax=Micavibrio aeruginosavorus TaxID=349221 RepID=UPI003F4AA3A5
MFFQNSDVSMRTRLCVIPTLMVMALVGVSPKAVMAQDAVVDAAPVADPLMGDDGKLKPITDQYIEMSIENLSKMYWALGLPSLDREADIDTYLLINECDMYRKFYHNDFEWQEIRRVTRDAIQKSLGTYPQKFEVIMPLYLDRYDLGTERFLIQPDSQFVGVTRLDTRYNATNEEICGSKRMLENYPRNLVLNFTSPFNLKDIPVKPEVAEFYMQEAMRQYEGLPPKLKMAAYERVAFVRLKVSMLQFKEFRRVGQGPLKGVFFSQIDGYEIFADQDKRLLMYSEDFSNGRIKRRRVGPDGVMAEDTGPIIPSDEKSLLSPTRLEQ